VKSFSTSYCVFISIGVMTKSDGLTSSDLPPLKWSSLKYVFRMEDKIDGKEEAYG
jgi:hypothetical protein